MKIFFVKDDFLGNSDGTWQTISHVIEQDDHLEIDGEIFHKPFVEKPVSAENHDVYMYFPSSAGGGSQRLFRKVCSSTSVNEIEMIFFSFGLDRKS